MYPLRSILFPLQYFIADPDHILSVQHTRHHDYTHAHERTRGQKRGNLRTPDDSGKKRTLPNQEFAEEVRAFSWLPNRPMRRHKRCYNRRAMATSKNEWEKNPRVRPISLIASGKKIRRILPLAAGGDESEEERPQKWQGTRVLNEFVVSQQLRKKDDGSCRSCALDTRDVGAP